jgi:N-acetylmuramoyl-L-alanine amidase
MRTAPDNEHTSGGRRRRKPASPTIGVGIAVMAVAGVAAVAAGVWGLTALSAPETTSRAPLAAEATQSLTATSSQAATSSAGMIEVPALVGLTLDEAQTVLSATGMALQVRSEDPTTPDGVDNVVDQDPDAGQLVDSGATVVLYLRAATPALSKAATVKAAARAAKKRPTYVVCIDPGHQARSNSGPEPVGPGSKVVKPKVTGGATGIKTGIPEYEIVLQMSVNLKERLEAQGVKVVMTRTTNDVNLSNSQRAAIANKAKADLLIRVHADGSADSDVSGISTLYPAVNRWTRATAKPSKRAARIVQAAVVEATGAIDRGTVPRSDLSGFNYCTRPAILVETGFVSNPVEDRLLASPHYQDKVAKGIATGVMRYLEGRP